VCSPIINKNLNAEEERFRSKIHFGGKLINEALNILKGCLDNMLNVLRDVIFPTNERLKTEASLFGAY
jgi:hypothetical protein